MNDQALLSQLLADLTKIKEVCSLDNLEYVPDEGIRYLCVNRDAIAFVIQQIYSKTDSSQRSALQRDHPELHEAVIEHIDQEETLETLDYAETSRRLRSTDCGMGLEQEEFVRLFRVLNYARYIALDPDDFELQRNPIENFGLKPRHGNFRELSESEWRAVPWHLADMVFDEKKIQLAVELKRFGLNLESQELRLDPPTWSESVTGCTELLVKLLEFRVQTDWAAVMSVSKGTRERYVNAIVRRLSHEFTNVLRPFHDALYKWVNGVNRLLKAASRERISVDRDLAPLKSAYDALACRVMQIQPPTSVYELILKLKGSNQQGSSATLINQIVGDLVMGDKNMGDKNVLKGQGVVAPGGVVVGNTFNQLWDQSGKQEQLPELAEQLKRLREAMRTREGGAEKDVALGNVASAEIAAQKGDGPQVLEYLSKAGKWAFDVATEIGVLLAASAIGKSMGLPGT